MSWAQLQSRRGDVVRFIEWAQAQRALLERAKNGATSVAQRLSLQSEIDRLDRLIEAARKELATIDAELEKVRAAAAMRKAEVKSRAEQSVARLEQCHAALIDALEKALEEADKFIRAAREVENRMDEARRLSEILGEPLTPVSKFPGGAHLPVAELKRELEGRLRIIAGWGRT